MLALSAETTRGGLLLGLDPFSGSRTTLAFPPSADLAGVAGGPGGVIYVLDRGRGSIPARVWCADPTGGTLRVVTSGGFLAEPSQCLSHPGGELLVVDREALGGAGALIRIDPVRGDQHLVSFGASFEEPADLAYGPGGTLLVLDRVPLRIDARGAQEELPLASDPVSWPDAFGDGAVLVDRGRVVYVDRGRAAPVWPPLTSIRDQVRFGERSSFYAWSEGGAGGVRRAFVDGTTETLVRGPDYADLRGIAVVERVDLGGLVLDDPVAPFRAPERPPLPPPSIELRAQSVTLLHGPGPQDDEVLPAGPYPLVTALRAAQHGSSPVIGVFGEIPGASVQIGGGESDQKAYVVHWGAVPMRFALVGMTADARIREFSLWQRMNNGRVNGGVAEARFEGLAIEARHSRCVGVPEGHQFGLLRLYDCRFVAGREGLATGDYGGFGFKWGIRSQGRGRWDLRGCTFAPVQEHAVYVDSPQGDCYFVDLQHLGSTRTAIQVVNRAFDNPGRSGFGTLLFENVRVFGLWGDGGSGITVAGHLGDLVFRDVQARESPQIGNSHGAIVVWTDASPQKGVHLRRGLDGGLYATGRVTIESADVRLPHADRAHVAISGAEEVVIDGFHIQGNRTAFNFDSAFGVPEITGPAVVEGSVQLLDHERIDNGRVSFGVPCPLSAYPGFRAAGKVQLGTRFLSDAEIDALYCPR
jgi:hypothetical protein